MLVSPFAITQDDRCLLLPLLLLVLARTLSGVIVTHCSITHFDIACCILVL